MKKAWLALIIPMISYSRVIFAMEEDNFSRRRKMLERKSEICMLKRDKIRLDKIFAKQKNKKKLPDLETLLERLENDKDAVKEYFERMKISFGVKANSLYILKREALKKSKSP